MAALTLTLAVACTSGDPEPQTVASTPGEGGTVRVYMQSLETLDPQRVYVVSGLNVSGLITRTLTTFTAKQGEKPKLVGDLATDTGKPNKDNTSWTYTLREGVKWQDGTTVSCEDVRYGVLRNFDVRRPAKDAVITGGPSYPTEWLDVPKDYEGPKGKKSDADLSGVTCEDKRTIRFDLRSPQANFPSAVGLPAFSPVPRKHDSWADYGEEPVSNGPYKLASYERADGDGPGRAVFERNRFWDSQTDELRQAKPDKIILELGRDSEKVAQQIVSDNPDYDNAVLYDSVPTKYVSQVTNDKRLKKQTVSGSTNTVTYMSINTETVSDLDCRRALVYAFNKSKYMDALGGEVFGDYATTILSPADPAYRDFDVYGLGGKPDGDLDKATELLEESGDCPTSLTLDIQDTPRGAETGDTIVETYGRLGVTVKLNKIDADRYYDTLAKPKEVHDLSIGGWIPDWPGGSGVIPALFDGTLIKNGLNNNYSLFDDPEINRRIAEAGAETDRQASYKLWADLDEEILKQAPIVPISYSKALNLCGPEVRGGVLNSQWGAIDIASLGVV